MRVCELADSDSRRSSETAVHFKQHSFKKCQGDFFTVFHMQGRGGREEAPCCFKAGKEANGSTILSPRLLCSEMGPLIVLSF